MHDISFLNNIIYLLVAAVFIVALFKKFHLSPVLGYFVAGALIGENGWFQLLNSRDTEVFGELGIIFLLFAIGLEMSFERLKAMRVYIFGLGGLQLSITGLLIGLALIYYLQDMAPAIVIASGIALSSTAIVLQVLLERRRQSSQVGRVSIAILLMQDFAVVPLLVLVPLLVSQKSMNIGIVLGSALTKALIALAVIFIVGRLLLRPMFAIIKPSFRDNDLFVASTLLIVLASALLTQKMGLSTGLGAFAAGLLVAETGYQLQAEESIAPFKGLFLGLFFMSVGMLFNISFIVINLVNIAIITILIIITKFIVIYLLCRAFKLNKGNSMHAGLLLAQGGEFSFILFDLASKKSIFSHETGQILMIATTFTMALTPLLSILGEIVSDYLDQKEKMKNKEIAKETSYLEKHIIIIGFGRVGKMVAKVLEAEKINYLAIDSDPNHVIHERKEGFPVYLGKGEDATLLESVGIERAQSVIVTVDSEEALRKCTKRIRKHVDYIPIIGRAKDLAHEKGLHQSGVTAVVPETYETGLQMAGTLLKSIGISENEVNRIKEQFRLGNYVAAHSEITENNSND
ncbi:MAG: cation:proton antiporter [Rickettsiales bacterium]|nr:cation:proton antiporter [Rickettsiales bacterium]